jgi:hypothetical protein
MVNGQGDINMTVVKNGLRKTSSITVHIKPLEGFLFKNKESQPPPPEAVACSAPKRCYPLIS